MLLEDAADAREQVIVAAAVEPDDPRHEADGLPVEPDLADRRADQIADEHHVTALLGPCQAAHAPELAERDPVMLVALARRRFAPAADRKQHRPPPPPQRRIGDGERQWP